MFNYNFNYVFVNKYMKEKSQWDMSGFPAGLTFWGLGWGQ